MSGERDGYQAYLLRIWRVRYKGQWQWRASIDSPRTGERRAFADLAAFVTFLYDATCQQIPPGGVDRQEVSLGIVPSEEEEKHDV